MQTELLKEKIYRCFDDQKLKNKASKIISNGAMLMFALVVIGIVFLILLTFTHGTTKLIFIILGSSFSVLGIVASLISSLVATRMIKRHINKQYLDNVDKYYEFINTIDDQIGLIWKDNSIQITYRKNVLNLELLDEKKQIKISVAGNTKTIDNQTKQMFNHSLKWSDKLIVWSKNTYYNTSVEFVANAITNFIVSDLNYFCHDGAICA